MRNIYLHFLADFPVLLKVNEFDLGTLECKEDTLSVEVCGNQEIFAKIFPISLNDFVSIPYAVKITVQGDSIFCESPHVEITNYYDTHFEINLKPLCVLAHKKQILIDNIKLKNMQIAIFDNGQYNLEITTKTKIYKFTLSEKIIDYKFEEYTQNETEFLILEGKTTKKQCFLLVLSSFFCNLEIVCDYYERTKTSITTLTYQKDIAKHGVVQKYELQENHFVLKDEYTVFVDQTPHITKDSKVVPWAFAEAVNIGDIKLARSYLDNSLNAMLDDEHLVSFFGDYSEIKWNRYANSPNTLCFIYGEKNKRAKTFQFEVKDNKICNITNLD